MNIDDFIAAYREAALWSSLDHNDKPLDKGEFEVSDELDDKFTRDCEKFLEAHEPLLDQAEYIGASEASKSENAGHDFWLTRCGHGAGFWDGDWTEPFGEELSEAAMAFGNADLYVGDDNLIYGI